MINELGEIGSRPERKIEKSARLIFSSLSALNNSQNLLIL